MNRTSPQNTALMTTAPHSFVGGDARNLAKLHKQRGFDLIQIAIVIGVIGILMAGAFLGVPAVMASVRATGEAQDLQAYVSNQQAALNSSAKIDNASVIADKLYNVDMTTAPGTLRNRFGGVQTIAGAPSVADFSITSTQVPSRACEKLIPVVAPLFEVITVDGKVIKDTRATTPVVLTRAAISTSCVGKSGVVTLLYNGTR